MEKQKKIKRLEIRLKDRGKFLKFQETAEEDRRKRKKEKAKT